MDAKEVMLEGLRAALREATGNLYRVYMTPEISEDRETRFLRGVKNHRAHYERMVALVTGEEK